MKSTQPVWKLYYNGAVGPQAILGIPMLRRLKLAYGAAMKVWPFETGWKALTEADLNQTDVLVAELAPASASPQPMSGESKDAAQVRALAEHFAKLDETGKLGSIFAPPKGVADEIVTDVQSEEGWALAG